MQLSMCVTKSQKGFTKHGNYTEVRVRHDARYRDVCESATTTLDLSDELKSDSKDDDWFKKQLTLFQVNAVVQD